MPYGDRTFPFPRKSRRCRHFDDDGRAILIRGVECPYDSYDCWFAHPDDPEWEEIRPRGRRTQPWGPPPSARLPDRRESFSSSSRPYGGRERSRERGRGYSPRRSRSRERGSSAKGRRDDSVASSREGDNVYLARPMSGRIPTEPAAHRSPTSIDSTPARATSGTASALGSASKAIKIDFVNPKPPVIITPSPVPPTPSTPSGTLQTLGPPVVLTSSSVSQQPPKSREQLVTPGGTAPGGIVVPALPPSAARSVDSAAPTPSTRFAVPPPPVSITTPSTPLSTSFASQPPSSTSLQDGIADPNAGGADRYQPRTPVFIKAAAPLQLRISQTPSTGRSSVAAAGTATDISSSSPAAASVTGGGVPFTPGAAAATATATAPTSSPNIASVVAAETNTDTNTDTDTAAQPEVVDVEMLPPGQNISGLTSEASMVQARASPSSSSTSVVAEFSPPPQPQAVSHPVQQLEQQAEDVSPQQEQLQQPQFDLQPLLPPPPLPPMPNLEVTETTVDELSHEAKIELWNKRVKTIAELLVHHDQVAKITSDINDLKRYASSSYFSAASTSTSNANEEDEKKRVENNLSTLHTARDSAKQAMQKLLDGLVVSDPWPSAPVIEDVQKQNAKVGEYVKELEGAMKRVVGDLDELAEATRQLGEKSERKKRKKKMSLKGKEKENVEEGEGTDADKMDVDAEGSNASTSRQAQTSTEISMGAKGSVESEEESSDSHTSSKKTRRFYQKISTRLRTLQDQVDTLQNVLVETESTWIQETQDLHASLLSKHRSSLKKHRTSLESSLSTHTSPIKSSLSQLTTSAASTSAKLDTLSSEQSELLERVKKLEGERDRLKAGQKKFWEEEMPGWKKRFEDYEREREKDRRRVGALEAAMNAYTRRPPVPLSVSSGAAFGSWAQLMSSGAGSGAGTDTSAGPAPGSVVSPTTTSTQPTPSQPASQQPQQQQSPPQDILLNLLRPQLTQHLREQVKPLIEEFRNKVEERVNAQTEEMRVGMWEKVELTWKVLREIEKKIGVVGESTGGGGGGGGGGAEGEAGGGGEGSGAMVVDGPSAGNVSGAGVVGRGETRLSTSAAGGSDSAAAAATSVGGTASNV